jgi:hypothetical protein
LGLTPEIQSATMVKNIITRIAGTESQEAILLVAHLDSRNGPGATDNGSGVAVFSGMGSGGCLTRRCYPGVISLCWRGMRSPASTTKELTT